MDVIPTSLVGWTYSWRLPSWFLFSGLSSCFSCHQSLWRQRLITTTRSPKASSWTPSRTGANATLCTLGPSWSVLYSVPYRNVLVVSEWPWGMITTAGCVERATQARLQLMKYLRMPRSGFNMVSIIINWLNISYYCLGRTANVMFSSLLVCKFVCLCVCLLATLRENSRTDFHEIFRICWARYKEQSAKFGG